MANLIGGRANVAIAKTTKTFAALGFNATNMEAVFQIGAAGLKSWKPGRAINDMLGTTAGMGYYMTVKTNLNLPGDFQVSYPDGSAIPPDGLDTDPDRSGGGGESGGI